MEHRRIIRGVKFSISEVRENNRVYGNQVSELSRRIDDLNDRFTEHVSKEESFWIEMTEMKFQISSMFTAATWLIKITRTLFVVAVSLSTVGVSLYEWLHKRG